MVMQGDVKTTPGDRSDRDSATRQPFDAPDWEKVTGHPAWSGYRRFVAELPRDRFPDVADLQRLLPTGTRNQAGHAVRFTASELLPPLSGEGAYEREIYATGRVSTRAGSLHDLCNALVWARFPRLKAALNQRHQEALPDSVPGRRGPVRDALTLFDECGLVLSCCERAPLEALAAHDWGAVFGKTGEAWHDGLRAWMVGHANLEKLFAPYKAMTGHCLLLHTREPVSDPAVLDRLAAEAWLDPRRLTSPRDLCPLPFLGIPGWYPGAQDAAFYDDPSVFRPPPPGRSPAPVWSLSA